VIATPDALLAADSVPHAMAVQPVPASAHVTPLFELSFATVAVKLICCPTCTEAVTGATVTDMLGVGVTGAGAGLLTEPPPQPPSTSVTARKMKTIFP
jgi:hypothetical protein